MSWVAVAVAGVSAAGSFLANESKKQSSKEASDAQVESAQAGISEQRRQFDEIQTLLAPYVSGGENAFTAQQNLVGLGGEEAQRLAIQNIEQGPQFQAQVQQGEEAILQNASATGALRGGNTQAALAQFRPALLSQNINEQFSRLGGLSNIGQSSAARVGSAAQQTGANVSNLLQQRGQAQAGGALAQGTANAEFSGDIAGLLGNLISGQQGGF